MIVDISMFVGERGIPNTGDRNVMDKLNWFIDKYEPKCLDYVLGFNLYSEMLNNPSSIAIQNLINGTTYIDNAGNTVYWMGLTTMIVDYVYYYYMNDDVTSSSGKGMIISKKDAAFNISPAQKMIDAWNEFVRISLQCVTYLTAYSNTDIYPQYTLNYGNSIVLNAGFINEFDI